MMIRIKSLIMIIINIMLKKFHYLNIEIRNMCFNFV